MKSILQSIKNVFIRTITKDIPNPLGRWNTNHCDKQMRRKIDLSNEDHCGPCGEYAMKQIKLQEKIEIDTNIKKT